MPVVYRWDALQPQNPAQRVVVDDERIGEARSSYAFQAYLRRLAGSPIPDDLLGQDRPADVDHMMQQNATWLADGRG
ncbi:hypothetical protein tb265_45490 [Gemmatimonadetes bacterium T265]|nr:hypothetical protein tb265_45490 [Gemmatimonadetes bacterium T265]